MNLLQSLTTLVDAAQYDAAGKMYIAIGIIMLAMSVSSIAEGIVCAAALKGMARNPETSKTLRSTMVLGVALCESVAIYGLVLCLIILFAKAPL